MARMNPLALPPGLRQPITIQAQTGTADTLGTPAWVAVLNAFGVIATISSKEVYQASQFVADVTHSVSIAYPPGVIIAGGMRVLFGARTFTIQTVDNVQERNRILRLACLEINAQQ